MSSSSSHHASVPGCQDFFKDVHPRARSCGLGALFGLLYLYFTWNFDYWKKKGVPYVKPEFFFGNIRDLTLLRVAEGIEMKRLYDELDGKPFGGVFQLRDPLLLLRDPDLIKTIMIKDFAHFLDRFSPVDEKAEPLSAHLGNLKGTRWRALRSKLTPTFTSGKMKMMYHLMEECSVQLCEHLAEPARLGKQLELRDVLALFTTDIIGTCAFGLQLNSMKNPNNEFRRMGQKVFEASIMNFIRRIVLVFFTPIARLFNVTLPSQEVSNFFLSAVKDTVNYREEKNVKRNDFLQLLMQIKNKGCVEDEDVQQNNNEDQIKMTDNLLAAQVFVFFVAGFETSSTAMSFALYELALNPDIQEKLREEVDAVTQNYDGKVTYEAIQEMTYLDKVIAESLRKYPPIGTLMRECTKTYTIPETDVVIEKGTRVMIPVQALHYDPKYYPDPQRFDPERFNEENKSSRHHFTYLPFGEGPRNCIGMKFGLLQAKLGLATLLQSYQFSPCERTVVPIRQDPKSLLVTASADGIWLKISPRNLLINIQ